MAVAMDFPSRTSSVGIMPSSCLEDRFEVIKEIGDGSFGSVTVARVRTAGAHVAKRGTMVAIKTMKKTFDSFAPCLELREVIFLRSLPTHAHLVPALDIFLDPTSKKLHICMEYMDGNLYQLMKARDHRCLDSASVKSILYQIIAGLDHIHTNNFFHRDIKPENILISTSAPQDSSLNFRRYSSLVTPPSTPPVYSVKIADFGLARETHSKLPYTTYVSTRWYRAPEVLLRAGEYSAPVDIWALGAMAVEVATLKPLFPGGNEVDQVWRICEIMGSPGNWYNKSGVRIGGGDWKEGTRLAQKLGFSFPKMAPHTMDTVLQPPQWPLALSNFVTWCLMWDPKNRPTSFQAMNHEYFSDAVDPLMRQRHSAPRLLGRKASAHDPKLSKESSDPPALNSRPSWFRKSLIGRDIAPVIQQQLYSPQSQQPQPNPQLLSPRPSPVHTSNPTSNHNSVATTPGSQRPSASKRATWSNGPSSVSAPMPILPTIRPVSPLSNAVTAQARSTAIAEPERKASQPDAPTPEKKKLGRQLSLASHGNHYADIGRGDSSVGGLSSPTSGQKESFFSHLRKRARRLSGRNQIPITPKYDDVEANAGCGLWTNNRSSIVGEPVPVEPTVRNDFTELDRALQNVRYSLDALSQPAPPQPPQPLHASATATTPSNLPTPSPRSSSLPGMQPRSAEESGPPTNHNSYARNSRRLVNLPSLPSQKYDVPDEEEELLSEALHGVRHVVRGLDAKKAENDHDRHALAIKDVNRLVADHTSMSTQHLQSPHNNPYPTPSPSAKRNGVFFSNALMDEPATPINIARRRSKEDTTTMWPTPPYDENEWAASAAASIFAATSAYR